MVEATLRRSALRGGGSLGVPARASILSTDVVWKATALLAGLAAAVTAVVVTRPESTTAVDVRPAAVWLSGEARGRIVLAGARSERPSVALQIGDIPAEGAPSSEYDIAEGAGAVFVHERLTGSIRVLDARDGAEVGTIEGPVATAARPQVVGAGSAAYLVDAERRTVRRLEPTATMGESFTVEQGFTDWAGSADGLLWLVNDADGSYWSFDGTSLIRTASFATPGTDLSLAVVGVEPVVVDPSTGRLRWLRLNDSVDIGAPVALLQDSDPAATCAAVLAGAELTCHAPDGPVRRATLAQVPALDGAQLIADEHDAVITRAGDGAVTIVDWATGAVRQETRNTPSARRTVGTTVTGTIVVDDPGSQFAFSVDRGEYVVLDKFSKRTIVIGDDGESDQGVGQLDENADVAGVFSEDDAAAGERDDNGRNDPPDANDDRVVTRVGRSITFDPLSNDIDPENDPLSILDPIGPIAAADGSLTILNGARVSYTPPAQSNDRSISFPYRIADIGGLEAGATITIEIIGSGRNTAPELADDEIETLVGASVDVPVLANDVDPEGDPLSIVQVSDPANGTAAIGADGSVRYEPAPDFVGTDEFTYRASDGYGEEAEASVRVRVVEPTGTNGPPVARDDRAATTAGQRVRIEALANDLDPDGDTLRIIDVSPLANVTIDRVGERAVDVTPSAEVAGLISFSYTIADEGDLTDTGRISVWVEPITSAEPPIAVDDQATSASVAIPIEVVANDIDPNGGQLTVESWTQPAQGSVARVSPTALQFTPVAGQTGTVSFTYTVRNAANLTATATVTVTVTPPTGSGPVAVDDTAAGFVGERILVAPLANDNHPDRLPIDFAGPLVVRAGRATINPDKTVTFEPPRNAPPATYRLTYTIQDVNGRRSSATITITVAARPTEERPPLAANDLAQTTQGTAVIIDVLANDEDPDGDPLRVRSFTQPASGTVDRSGNRLVYTPTRTTTGVVTFQYVVEDDADNTATATVTVSVAEPARVAPQANDDLASIIVGATSVISPLANDSDPDGPTSALVLETVGAPSSGAVTATQTGNQIRITGNQVGTATIRYVVRDGDGQTSSAIITVAVQPPPNTAPNAQNDTASTQQGSAVSIDVLANDTDVDGGVLALAPAVSVAPPGAGSAAVSGGSIVFTPAASFTGTANLGYTVRDAGGLSDTATVVVTVVACPALPSMPALSETTRFNTPATVTLFAAVPAGNAITLGSASAGTVALQGGGTQALYTPPATFNGTATFSYIATNTCGRSATGTVTVTVNRAPVAGPDTASTARNTAIPSVAVLGNDTDPDSDAIVVDAVRQGTGGTVALTGQTISFTPTTGFVGVATFEYRVRDVGGLFSPYTTVRVTVANQQPVATPDVGTLPTGGSVTIDPRTNDSDPGDTLTVTAASLASPTPGATVTFTGTGVTLAVSSAFTIPAGQPSRTVVVNYTVADGTGTGALDATSTITFTVTNRAPTATPDTAPLDLRTATSVAVPVLTNDSDPESPSSSWLLEITAQPTTGTATVSGGQVTYSHGSGTVPAGPVIITYRITDPNGGTATSTITITVTDSTPPPTTTTTTTPPAGP